MSLSVIGYISQTFPTFGKLPSNELIRTAFNESLFHPNSSDITTTLSLLALSLSTGTPLTRGVQAPAMKRQQRLLQMGADRLGVHALDDPNLKAFVVVETASSQLVDSLAKMVDTVRELVGTMDFGEEFQEQSGIEISVHIV